MLEQLEKDIQASHDGLLGAKTGSEKIQKELVKLSKEVEVIEVSSWFGYIIKTHGLYPFIETA